MANTLKLLFLLFVTALRVMAQAGNTLTIPFAGVPTGNCAFLMLGVDTTNQNQYFCPAGAWVKVTSSGGGGINSFNGLVAAGQTVTNDTNITWTSSAPSTHTLGFTGTLAAGRLNPNVVQAITNDTNVTGSISAQNLTLGWAGALAIARGGLGVSLAGTGGAHQFLRQNSVGANITVIQPACGDLSDSVASCNTDATNATNITSGSLPLGRLPWTTRGDLLTVGAGPVPARLALGTTGQCLTSNGTDTVWASCATGAIGGAGSAITYSVFTAPGTINNGHITEDNTTNQLSATKSLATPAPTPISFSATPTIDLSTCNRCEMAAMTANVNSVTFINAKAGLRFSLTLLQNNSGGFTNTGYVVAGGTVTNVCSVSPVANVRSTQEFEVASDGLTIRGGECYSDETGGTIRTQERSAPTDTPATGAAVCWFDSTDHSGLECHLNGNTASTFKMVLAGVDVNTITGQVTGTHLAGALPINQGGSGTTSVLTGFIRGGNPFGAAELSGDSSTSGSWVVTNLRVNGVSYPSNPPAHAVPVVTAANSAVYKVIPDCPGVAQGLNYSQSSDSFNCNTFSGGGGTGTIVNPQVIPSFGAPILPLGLATNATVTIFNTGAATSMIGGSFIGSNQLPSGYWVGRTIVARATGAYSTTGTPTFAVTMTIGGTTVATFTVTTPNGASSVGWEAECRSTPANSNPLTTVNTTCRFWDGSGTRGFNSQTVSSLNFATTQAVDMTATWGTPSMSNTATIYNASLQVM